MWSFSNSCRRVFSGYLILVTFLYVLAAKHFHTHHHESNTADTAGILMISHTSSCDICEFQFTGCIEINCIQIQPVENLLANYCSTYVQQNKITHYTSSIADRGPPVMALI